MVKSGLAVRARFAVSSLTQFTCLLFDNPGDIHSEYVY